MKTSKESKIVLGSTKLKKFTTEPNQQVYRLDNIASFQKFDHKECYQIDFGFTNAIFSDSSNWGTWTFDKEEDRNRAFKRLLLDLNNDK